MTRYYLRLDAATGALVPYIDATPNVSEGRRVMLRCAAAGGAFAFGVSALNLEVSGLTAIGLAAAGWGAVSGGVGLAVKVCADAALEWRRQSLAFEAIQLRLVDTRVQTVQPDLTPRPLPAVAEIVMPDSPVSHAERDARHEAIRLLTDAARVVGWDGNTIPRYARLRWGNERRARAVASLAEWLEVTPGRETRVKSGTLRELHDMVQTGKVKAKGVTNGN